MICIWINTLVKMRIWNLGRKWDFSRASSVRLAVDLYTLTGKWWDLQEGDLKMEKVVLCIYGFTPPKITTCPSDVIVHVFHLFEFYQQPKSRETVIGRSADDSTRRRTGTKMSFKFYNFYILLFYLIIK